MCISICGLSLAEKQKLSSYPNNKRTETHSLSTIVLHGPVVDVTPLQTVCSVSIKMYVPASYQHLLESHLPGVLRPSMQKDEEDSDNAHCLFSTSVKLARPEA